MLFLARKEAAAPAGWLWHQDQGDRNRWTPRNSEIGFVFVKCDGALPTSSG